jgi:hypothetical protein
MDGIRSRGIGRRAAGLVSLALAVTAWSSAPALADPAADYAAGSAPLASAQQIARAYWGADACGGQVDVSWTTLDPDTNAMSYWSYTGGPYDAATYSNCRISFNTRVSWSWNKFCTVLVHEYGHLTGHAHAEDEGDVMYAYYEKPLPVCEAADPAPAPVVSARPTTGTGSSAVVASKRAPRRAHHAHVRAHRHHGRTHARRGHAHRRVHSKAWYRRYLRRHPGLAQRLRRAHH